MDPSAEVPKEHSPKPAKIEKLFGHSFLISHIDNSDIVPAGGESTLSDDLSLGFIGDFDQFKDLFKTAKSKVNPEKFSNVKDWLGKVGLDIDERLFALLYGFTKTVEEKYPPNTDKASIRKDLYRTENPKLSEIFNRNAAECVEIAAVAQYFLQQGGVSSEYFSGEVLWSKDSEFAEPHSYILVRDNGKSFIFDPTNPTDTDHGLFPSIYPLTVNFHDEMKKEQKRFVGSTNALSKRAAFFGIGNHTNVSSQNII